MTFLNDETIPNLKKSFQDGVDSLYDKLKSLGTTPNSKDLDSIKNSIQKIYDDRYNSGYENGKKDSSATGDAVATDVLSGKTFSNSTSKGITGTMTNNGAKTASYTPSSSSQSYTISEGYHNGNGKVTINAVPTESKTITLTSSQTGTSTHDASSGKFWSSVTVNASNVYEKGKTDGSMKRYYNDNAQLTSNVSSFINVGFRPKFIWIGVSSLSGNGMNLTFMYDATLNKCWYNDYIGISGYYVSVGEYITDNMFRLDSITDNGFYITCKFTDRKRVLAFG